MCGLQRSGINSSDVEMLTLTNVTEDDAGEYICKVSNYIGEANQSGWLTVIPGNPWDLTPPSYLPFPGVVSLTCCAVLVLLVVSWWSLGSQNFSPLMLDLCVPAAASTAETSAAMEALLGPAYLETVIVTACVSRTSLKFFSHIFLSCKLCQDGVRCCSAVLSMLSVFVSACGQSYMLIRLASISRFCWWREPFGFLFLVYLFYFLMFWWYTGLYPCLCL